MFLHELKFALVIPIYKDQNSMMYNRQIEFTNKHDILYKYQFVFRGEVGINTDMIILIDKIVSALDNGNSVIEFFLHFFRAFNTVDHTI